MQENCPPRAVLDTPAKNKTPKIQSLVHLFYFTFTGNQHGGNMQEDQFSEECTVFKYNICQDMQCI